MDIIYVLVPLSLILLGGAMVVFFWAVKGGQYDDLDSPAHRILFDDDEHLINKKDKAAAAVEEDEKALSGQSDDSNSPFKETTRPVNAKPENTIPENTIPENRRD